MSRDLDDELSDYGFKPMAQPTFSYPTVTPEALTSAGNSEFGSIYATVNAWSSYTRETLAQVEAQLVAARNRKNLVTATVRKEARPQFKNRPGQELDDEVAADPRVVGATEAEEHLVQLRVRLEALCANLQADLNLVSRFVEVRRQEFEQNRVEAALPLRRMSAPSPVATRRP